MDGRHEMHVINELEEEFSKEIMSFENPLHLAVKRQLFSNVKHLVEDMHFDVNSKDKNGDTPLHWLVRNSANIRCEGLVSDMLDFLEARGADVEMLNKRNERPIVLAALYNQEDIVQRWLLKDSIDILTRIKTCELLSVAQILESSKDKSKRWYEKALQIRLKHGIDIISSSTHLDIFNDFEEPRTVEAIENVYSSNENIYTLAMLIIDRDVGKDNVFFFKACFFLERTLWESNYSLQQIIDFIKFHRSTLVESHFMEDVDGLTLMYPFEDNEVVERDATYFIVQNDKRLSDQQLLDFFSFYYVKGFQILHVLQKQSELDEMLDVLVLVDLLLSRNLSEENLRRLQDNITVIISITRNKENKQQFSPIINTVIDPMLTGVEILEDNGYFKNAEKMIDLCFQCGASALDVDCFGNNALHCLLSYWLIRIISDLDEEDEFLHEHESILRKVLEHGADVDIQNRDGDTPLHNGKNTKFKSLLHDPRYRSLQCLAATAVIANNIPFEGIVSKPVQEFIKYHKGN